MKRKLNADKKRKHPSDVDKTSNPSTSKIRKRCLSPSGSETSDGDELVLQSEFKNTQRDYSKVLNQLKVENFSPVLI